MGQQTPCFATSTIASASRTRADQPHGEEEQTTADVEIEHALNPARSPLVEGAIRDIEHDDAQRAGDEREARDGGRLAAHDVLQEVAADSAEDEADAEDGAPGEHAVPRIVERGHAVA